MVVFLKPTSGCPLFWGKGFKVLSNELSSPGVLLCPSDGSKQPAKDFAHLGAANVSYRVRSGAQIKDGDPGEILATCPLHNLFIMCDSSVLEKARPAGR